MSVVCAVAGVTASTAKKKKAAMFIFNFISFSNNCLGTFHCRSAASTVARGAALAALRTTPGCLLARMSGSGATCFGVFADAIAATAAAEIVRRPGWWVWGGAC